MTRRKTIPVPAEKVYAVARDQLATSELHLEAVNEQLEKLYAKIQENEQRKRDIEQDIKAMRDFLGEDGKEG